ncbi:MAG: UDP-3-O-(3-hydroxymyristoyl)glucosamine N-acyltransferase [Flavobacteriales bacterium]|nr:UDP-3-O-(3-hydroxymyristoyl)glucosamine N-acyltransferase [Flavobacteriales bacterium]MBK7553360.1 UDP-3-O-(3-hydroxymyristoyl)glucosamine N-acyltransferase [Flavobacteriales bacterium]MBK9194976.1 UDP-3-O-(3-hydroxymyristoyl)glucosamine N-acyltransferase [Flavobacteriales bacterium]MBP6575339.1 UDP-3-O-(3-hydroxymyristoyl)glucosamine N-acyltransferase [Flavobacteriales bacterium]
MDLKQPMTAAEVARMIDGRVIGNAQRSVTGINEMNRVREGDLIFVDHEKYYRKALESAATTILINKEVEAPEGKALIVCSDPCSEYNKLVRHFMPRRAWGSDTPTIGEGSEIHPSVVFGANVTVGAGCLIMPGVVIYENTTIGDRVIIHANSVIGCDGFYYKKRPSGHEKMPPCGSVVIEDDVEIGGGCVVDRGISSETRIGAGTKLDNMVHIAHDVVIGKNCLLAAQVSVAGATTLGDGCTMWGQSACPPKITLGNNTTILGQSAPMNSADGGNWLGSPAVEARQKFREIALIRRLPEVFAKLGL